MGGQSLSAETDNESSSENRLVFSEDVTQTALRQYLDMRAASDDIAVDQALVWAFLVHQRILETCPLSVRVGPAPILPIKLRDYLEKTFFPALFGNLDKVLNQRVVSGVETARSEVDIDGNLFGRILVSAAKSGFTTTPWTAYIPAEEVKACLVSVKKVSRADQIDLTALKGLMEDIPRQKKIQGCDTRPFLLPFKEPLFSELLKGVQVPTKDIEDDEDKATIAYLDDKHWHVDRLLSEGDKRPAWQDAWLEKKRLRREQNFMATFQKSAASLTGASGAILEKTSIPLVKSSAAAKRKEEKAVKVQVPRSGKEKPMTKVEKMKAEILAKK